MGNSPWRKTKDDNNFIENEKYLKEKIKEHSKTPLRLCLVGHSGAGKSSFINSIFTASRGQICDMSTEKNDKVGGFGTHVFRRIRSGENDIFQDVEIFDSMGIAESVESDKNEGINTKDLKHMCEGRIKPGHKFNEDSVNSEGERTYQPQCVMFVVSAETLLEIEKGLKIVLSQKLQRLHSTVPEEIARVTVITKCDKICSKVTADIANIYISRKIYEVVDIASKLFGVAENRVFPVVNYVKQVEVDEKFNVPILYPLLFALNFSLNRVQVSGASSD